MAFSFAKSFNKERLFDIDTSEFEYCSLEDLYAEVGEGPFEIRGVYINTKGLYDDAPVLAIDDRYVNLPAHLVDACRAMLSDNRCVRAINDGKCGFKIYTYRQKRFNKECYSVEWVDLQ